MEGGGREGGGEAVEAKEAARVEGLEAAKAAEETAAAGWEEAA